METVWHKNNIVSERFLITLVTKPIVCRWKTDVSYHYKWWNLPSSISKTIGVKPNGSVLVEQLSRSSTFIREDETDRGQITKTVARQVELIIKQIHFFIGQCNLSRLGSWKTSCCYYVPRSDSRRYFRLKARKGERRTQRLGAACESWLDWPRN